MRHQVKLDSETVTFYSKRLNRVLCPTCLEWGTNIRFLLGIDMLKLCKLIDLPTRANHV